ncbi:MAG: hypothetical protein JWQ09_962, partial [Segetibacter sp.]|nr:hypothetical protein [Segetibacter sp.]
KVIKIMQIPKQNRGNSIKGQNQNTSYTLLYMKYNITSYLGVTYKHQDHQKHTGSVKNVLR